jgi:hypothetical protein
LVDYVVRCHVETVNSADPQNDTPTYLFLA